MATVWTSPTDGQPYLLIVNEGIYCGDSVRHSLLNPNQLRANGIIVDDCPKQFDKSSTHSLSISDHELTIPLTLSGVISSFETHKPTLEELHSLPTVALTSDTTWDPSSAHFAEAEASISAIRSMAYAPDADARAIAALRRIDNPPLLLQEDEGDLYDRLISAVCVAADDLTGQGTTGHEDPDIYPGMKSQISALHTTSLRKEDDHPAMLNISAMRTTESRSTITPQMLSSRWGIGLDTAKRTLSVTTQSGIRNVLAPSERKVRLKAPWLKFPSLDRQIFADALYSKVPGLHKETGGTIFTDGKGYDFFYPWTRAAEYSHALMSLIHDAGVPKTLVTDGGTEMVYKYGRKVCNEYHINMRVTVPHSPWQNLAEASVRELKRSVRRKIRRTKAPRRTWAYCGKWAAAIRRLTSLAIPELHGRTPMERVEGTTPDITAHALFDFYETVYYYTPVTSFPFEKKTLGKWLGVAYNATDALAYVILTPLGTVIIRKSVWAIPEEDKKTDAFVADLIELDNSIQDRIGDQTLTKSNLQTGNFESLPPPPMDLFEGDHDDPWDPAEEEAQEDSEKETNTDTTPEEMDEYLTSQLQLPHGGEMQLARVTKRHKGSDGNPTGKRHENPILDSRQYEIEFPDGSTEVVAANLIAENLFSQVDEEGRSFQIMREITDHRKTDQAVSIEDGFTTNKHGVQRPKITTLGWELEVEWKDGSSSWIPLKDLKESNPLEVAEYACTSQIEKEPAFKWWVRHTLRKRDRIIKKVKSRYWTRSHKYGIELPHSVEEAMAIDKRTGTTFWRDAIEKEMKNVLMAFEYPEDGKPPVGYKKIRCHMIFDIKSTLTRKARMVAGGHLTDPPKDAVFSSVVTRDSVRIAFTIAALNDLEVLAGDVQNAYLNAPTKEKCWFIAGPEFGKDRCGTPVVIVRALYGLKSSGARWRDHMAATLRDAGYQSCYADPDVWMKKNTKPNGFKYWEYVLCYVDDVLVVSHEPQSVMDYLNSRYTMKEGSVKEPDEYLGAQVRKHEFSDGRKAWAMSSDLYVKRAVADVETELGYIGQGLRTKVTTPLSSTYRAELDGSPELDAKRGNYFQGLIGVLRWTVELGRIDIMVAVSMLSRYLASPREGHLEEAFHIFAYLKAHNRSSVVLDDATPLFDESRFVQCDWKEYYPNAHEPEPPRAPELRGNSVTTTCFVDADHAGCRETRRSHTGIIIFLQKAPITWYSKRQNTVESSTFGSEFVAMKIAIEQVEAMRYKLRMMGIPVDGPTNVFCDNESVFKNATRPESTLKKKHNAIAYHRTREAIAASIVRIAWEDGRFNIADVLTKLMPGPKLRELISNILY
jgi:hypothetical protein